MKILLTVSLLILAFCCYGQPKAGSIKGNHIGLTFEDAEKQGILHDLDSLYKSAMHTDTSKAVFKTEEEVNAMLGAYTKLLQDLGHFLSDNNFKWNKPTRCFNRIYFNTDGSVDYFLFNFLGKTNDKPSAKKQKEFQRLLTLFIKDYKFALTADTKFAQCSPVTYMPK